MDEVRPDEIVRKKEFHQKKSLGQHFLHDGGILNRIADYAGIEADDTVVEIGPGAGSLTRVLAQRAAYVRAVEVDTSLEPVLKESLAGFSNVSVIFRDFLRVPWREILRDVPEGPVRVTANIPYAITTDIVERLLEVDPSPQCAVLLMQKEAAERFISGPKTREYGPVPILIDLYTETNIAFDVSRESFTPPPHVESAVLSIRFLAQNEVPSCGKEKLKKLLHCAFSARRKQIHNNIRQLFENDESMDTALNAAGLNRTIRPEEITPEQYVILTGFLRD